MTPKVKKQLIAFVLVFFTISLGVFVLGVDQAEASWFTNDVGSVLGNLLLMAQGGVGWIVAQLSGLAQGLLGYTDLQNAPIVEKGWTIMRDLVNMFFVLVLLAIAFATILQIESHGMKTLLPKLIGVALLINFSLVFAGVIIDFSGVLTDFFLQDNEKFFEDISDQIGLPHILRTNAETGLSEEWRCQMTAGGESEAFFSGKSFSTKQACLTECNSNQFLEALDCKNVSLGKKTDWSKMNGDVYWDVIWALLLSIIFTVIAAFVFGALAFFLLVRVLAIWFLLILAPLAWFFWILPATKGFFTQWWNNFIKWVLFAPAVVFFIWLSVEAWTGFIKGQLPFAGEKISSGMSKVITNDVLSGRIIPEVMEPSYFVQFLLACGMLIGSLFVAKKIGIYGADGAIDIGKKWSKGLGMWASQRAQMKTARPAGWVGRQISKVGAIPGLGKITGVRQLARPFKAFEEKEKATIAEIEKKYKGWSSDNLKSGIKGVNPRAKVAIGKILAERSDFGVKNELGFTQKEIEKTLKIAKTYGQHGSILTARPDLAPLVKDAKDTSLEAIEKSVSGIKSSDVGKIQSVALTPEVMQTIYNEMSKKDGKWNKSHLSKAGDENPELRVKIKSEIIDDSSRAPYLRRDIAKYLTGEAGSAIYG